MKRIAIVAAVLALGACRAENQGESRDTASPAPQMAPAPADTGALRTDTGALKTDTGATKRDTAGRAGTKTGTKTP